MLPLVFHTERHDWLICTCEEADAIRVRVLRVMTPKMGRLWRSLSKTWGHERALSESSFGARGWGKTCREAECPKFHTHLETQAPVCGSHQSKTVTVEQHCLRIMDRAVEQEWVKIEKWHARNDLKTATFTSKEYREIRQPTLPGDNS